MTILSKTSHAEGPGDEVDENGGLRICSCSVCFLVKIIGINSEKCIEYGK